MRNAITAPRVVLLFAALAITIGLSACGSSSSGTSSTAAATTGSDGGSPGKALHFIYVTSNPSSEPTGAIINNGMVAAANELGVEAEYRSTKTLEYTPTELKRLVENAIASKPDGLIVADSEPKALNSTIKSATEQGIPVVLSSTGAGQTEAVGALTYVGNDEKASGRLGGELLRKEGVKHALLITLPPGIPIVEERNAGFEEGFEGEVTKLAVKEFTDVPGTTSAIVASLQKDSSIDGAFAVGSALSPPEIAAEKQLGESASGIKWSTIDLGPQVLEGIEAGTFSFAIDQQPYWQGYLPVLFLKQYLELGLKPVEPQIPTGPAVVNKENASQIQALSNEKLR
jgi:simple sugar transport system substrate-binding protein